MWKPQRTAARKVSVSPRFQPPQAEPGSRTSRARPSRATMAPSPWEGRRRSPTSRATMGVKIT